jgi:hypothetical protein
VASGTQVVPLINALPWPGLINEGVAENKKAFFVGYFSCFFLKSPTELFEKSEEYKLKSVIRDPKS